MAAQLDPRVSLAAALESQPGVYALLVGSGVSTGAGVPTGWGVVEDLIKRLAVASGAAPGASFNTEDWWDENGDGEPLGYSGILQRLGPTRAARRAIMGKFFEPTDDDRDNGLKVPSAAHRAIAKLVRSGRIRVIVTTNFDRLLERALEAEGISPQVISSDSGIAGMEPPQHMQCTILKLHGDYQSLDQRNTVDELSAYPRSTRRLLSRIFDEYGLIVSGWSGEWDPALVAALEANANRRYPLFWVSRSTPGEVARRLLARSTSTLIEGHTADEFFPDLVSRVEALESMSDTPASLNLLLGRVKRALPDPRRYIELQDLFDQQIGQLREHFAERGSHPPDRGYEVFQASFEDLAARTTTLAKMLMLGIQLDRNREHEGLWVHVIQQAMRARIQPDRSWLPSWVKLQHLPALILLTVGIATALSVGREATAISLLSRPRWTDPAQSSSVDRPAFAVLRESDVIDASIFNQIPSGTSGWKYPSSHHLNEATKPLLQEYTGNETEAEVLFCRTEYRFALATALLTEEGVPTPKASNGEFLVERYTEADSVARAWLQDFTRGEAPEIWGRGTRFTLEEFSQALEAMTARLEQLTHW